MAEVALAAAVRRTHGSSESRRLRSSGHIPGVVYGHGIDPTPISVESKALRLALNTDSGINALLALDVEGTKHLAMARAIQKHPVRNTVAHVDFQVVGRNEVVTLEVPFAFVGEAKQVQTGGGVLEHVLQSLTVSSTPGNVPDHIEVDVSSLELDSAIRVGDLQLPKGVTTDADPEDAIVVGKVTRASVAETADGEGESTVESGAAASETAGS